MTKFLLPCECGEAVPVEVGQAGQVVTCSCGRTLEVPTMRGIRQLEACEASPPPAAPANWNPIKGAFFAIGIVLALCGGITALYGYASRAYTDTSHPPAEQIDAWVHEIDEWGSDQMWTFWLQARDIGLPPGVTPYALAVRRANWFGQVGQIGAVIGLVGVVMTIGPVLIGGRRSRSEPTSP